MLERGGQRQHDRGELAVAGGAAEHAGALFEQQFAVLRGDTKLCGGGGWEHGLGLLAAAVQFAGEHGQHAGIQPAGQRVVQASGDRVLDGFE